MTLSCNYDINTGVINCDLPYLQSIDIGNGQTGYFSTLWTGSDVLISLFLFIIIIFLFARELFRFFFPNVIKIKRKNE